MPQRRGRVLIRLALAGAALALLAAGYCAHVLVANLAPRTDRDYQKVSPAVVQLQARWFAVEATWRSSRDVSALEEVLHGIPGITDVRTIDPKGGLFEVKADGARMLLGFSDEHYQSAGADDGGLVVACSARTTEGGGQVYGWRDRYLLVFAEGGARHVRSAIPPVPGCTLRPLDPTTDRGLLVYGAMEVHRLGLCYEGLSLQIGEDRLRVETTAPFTRDDPGR